MRTPGNLLLCFAQVIITGLVEKWAAWDAWEPQTLRAKHGAVLFNTGGYRMTLSGYFDYAAQVQTLQLAQQPHTTDDTRFSMVLLVTRCAA